jgi:hypothetical protein
LSSVFIDDPEKTPRKTSVLFSGKENVFSQLESQAPRCNLLPIALLSWFEVVRAVIMDKMPWLRSHLLGLFFGNSALFS